MDQMQELSPYSYHYIIPHNQQRIKAYGVVLFNTHNRLGAVSEAENFEQALETPGCIVFQMEWTDVAELHCMIKSALMRVIDDCSILFVAVMSHGQRGVLAGSDDLETPINDLLHQFTHSLPDYIPMVSTMLCYAQIVS